MKVFIVKNIAAKCCILAAQKLLPLFLLDLAAIFPTSPPFVFTGDTIVSTQWQQFSHH